MPRTTMLGAAIGAGLILALALPAAANAHDDLVDSTPGANATIDELPEVFSVTVNEPLLDLDGEASGFAIEVTDATGRYYGDGCLTVEGATLSTGAALGEAGDYTLTWQLVSEDGHTVSGSFGFTWTGEATAAGSATPPDCGGTAVREPASSATPAPREDARLGEVLWIGGALLAVLIAGLMTVLMLSRRRAR